MSRASFYKHIAYVFLILYIFSAAFPKNVFSQDYPFHNLTVENGLIQSQVRALAQDAYGHLWIGTIGGLSRYDGVAFTNFTVRDGLLDNEITTLQTDKEGRIWIGSRKGLSMYDGKEFRHYHFAGPESRTGNHVSEIHISSVNSQWCIAGNKIYHIRSGDIQPVILPDTLVSVTSVLPDEDTLWAAATGILYQIWGKQIRKLQFPTDAWPFIVNRCYRNRKGQVLLATSLGIFYISGNAISPLLIQGNRINRAVSSLSEDLHGTLWAGAGSGIMQITDTSIFYFNKKNGLSDNAFHDVYTDKEGNVWLASDGQGVFRFSGARFTLLNESSGLPGSQVMCFETDGADGLFLGTYDAGLYLYKHGRVIRKPVPFHGKTVITSLCYYKDTLWIGTGGYGIWQYDGTAYTPFRDNRKLPSTVVTRIYKDRSGGLCIGTVNGLGRYKNGRFSQIPSQGVQVMDIIDAGKDSLFVATSSGLKWVHGDSLSRYLTGSAPDSASLQCFTMSGSDLWIGSSDNGLIRYSPADGSVSVFNRNNGMQSDFIYNVTTDEEGNIWAGTGYGIHKIIPGKNAPTQIIFYGKNHGVSGMESNHNAVLRMPDNSIWFGTVNGALYYQPWNELVTPDPAGIIMQSVKLFGERLHQSPYADSMDAWYKVPYGLKLPYRKNNLSFSFLAITLSGDQVYYRYHLNGAEAGWSDWLTTNTITFPGLQPGKYTLEVACSTAGGGEVSGLLSYPFEIITPFHKTTWFRFLLLGSCIFLGVILQYGANRRKQNRKQLFEKLRKEEQDKVRQRTAEDFHDEIGNKLTRINILSNVLKNKIGPENIEGARIIRQIQENTASLYSGTKDIIWSLSPSNDNLWELLHHIRDFGDELFKDTAISFIFGSIPEAWQGSHVPIDISRNLIMIFKEALHNSLKYSGGTKVILHAQAKSRDTFEIVMEDDGCGFDMEKVKKGQGLNNMAIRAERIGGKLYIQSGSGKGTIIRVHFRLKESSM